MLEGWKALYYDSDGIGTLCNVHYGSHRLGFFGHRQPGL